MPADQVPCKELRRSVVQYGREDKTMLELESITQLTDDPVSQLLLAGKAETVREAEELYLDSCLPEVVRLLESPLSDDELGRHPLMVMLRAHGSRGWEEAVE